MKSRSIGGVGIGTAGVGVATAVALEGARVADSITVPVTGDPTAAPGATTGGSTGSSSDSVGFVMGPVGPACAREATAVAKDAAESGVAGMSEAAATAAENTPAE